MNESLLFDAIAAAVASTPISQNSINAEELEALYKISKKHDLAHIVGYILDKNKLLDGSEISAKFKKQVYLAIYRYQQLRHELDSICAVLEDTGIDHIPLKGAVIRDIYPEPWMRTSCDIDLLIREEDLEKARDVIIEKLNYSLNKVSYHDISLFSENGIHLELHFSLKENMENIDPILTKVWEHSTLSDGTNHKFIQSPEFFVFHHIAHMSYHFVHGGCGIKPFIDLYLIRKKFAYNESLLVELLSNCRLEKFYESVLQLSEVWFAGNSHTNLSRQIEEYILSGGVYGSFENSVSMQQEMKGVKFKYLMYKIFIPFELLKSIYPVLKKHPYLAPVMHVRRWIRVIFRKKTAKELGYVNSIDKDQSKNTKDLLSNIGLM